MDRDPSAAPGAAAEAARRAARRAAARAHHPDLGGDPALLQRALDEADALTAAAAPRTPAWTAHDETPHDGTLLDGSPRYDVRPTSRWRRARRRARRTVRDLRGHLPGAPRYHSL